MILGPPIKPKPKEPPPEWSRMPGRKGLYQHRDPPHRLRYDPDAWEQAAATLEDNAKQPKGTPP